jgi:hypothetical protein
MVIKTASPGVVITEVDLTRGNIDAITQNVGAIVGPFQKGPVDEFTLVNTELDLLNIFGKPTDENYEYWWTVNNFLSYGGIAYVLRADDSYGEEQLMRNATNGFSIYVKNDTHFSEVIHPAGLTGQFIARTPGTWGNSLGVSVIDAGADFAFTMNARGVSSAATGEILDGTFGGDFGDLKSGEVQGLSIEIKGSGFSVGEIIDNPTLDEPRPLNPDGSIPLPAESLSLIITNVDDEGPVAAVELTTAGAGYVSANNVDVTGSNGDGMKVNIIAGDTGAALTAAITNRSNNYSATLLDAGFTETYVYNVALTVGWSDTNPNDVNRVDPLGMRVVGDFTNGRMTAVRVVSGGVGYKTGDVFDIVQITGPAGARTVQPADVDTTIRITDTDAAGQVIKVEIATGGDLYSVGDVLKLDGDYTDPAYITVKSTTSNGALLRVDVQNSGINYVVGDTFDWTPIGGSVALGSTSIVFAGTPGTSYTPGLYKNVEMWRKVGTEIITTGSAADVTVDNLGKVSAVQVIAGGGGWKLNDTAVFDPDDIGGTATGAITSLPTTPTAAGSGYTNGAYGQPHIPATGGTGTGCTLSLSVSGPQGYVSAAAVGEGGTGYSVNDSLSFSNTNAGGVGSGFAARVATVAAGVVTGITIVTPGTGYLVGVYGGSAIPTSGGTGIGCGISFFVTGGRVGTVKLINAGRGYVAGDRLGIDNGYTGYAGSGFSMILAANQVDTAGSGFLGRVNDIDATPAQIKITNVAQSGEEIPSGFEIGDHNRMLVDGLSAAKLEWLVDPANESRHFKAVDVRGNDISTGSSQGHIFDYSESKVSKQVTNANLVTDNVPLYSIRYLSTTPNINVEEGQYIKFDKDPQVYGPVRFVSHEVSYYCYDNITLSANITNAVRRFKTYSAKDGNAKFGWPARPKNGARVTPSITPEVVIGTTDNPATAWNEASPKIGPTHLGQTFAYSGVFDVWVYQGEPRGNQLFYDGTYVYRLQAIRDWYPQQKAYMDIPWSRFAARPIVTQYGADRGTTNDALNILIYDRTGEISGAKGTLLESYIGVSKLQGNKTPEGDDNYYMSVINSRSQYVYANKVLALGSYGRIPGNNVPPGAVAGSDQKCEYIDPSDFRLSRGVDNLRLDTADTLAGYEKIQQESLEDLDYILTGPATPYLPNASLSNVIDASIAKVNNIIGIAEARQDCIAFVSPPRELMLGRSEIGSSSLDTLSITEDMIEWADKVTSSSYAVIDSGYKYCFDRFDDAGGSSTGGKPGYRFVPLNGDIAGTLVYSSIISQPWYSPAGMVRGQIRDVVSLPYNPNKEQRDLLYTHRINPVVSFPGEGTVLFGDKTALAYNSAFDRINVRKLFLVLERQIAKSARTNLFEFNDDVTRTIFKNNVNPFLRDVQAKRGMYDFLVICDETNNTPEVIDRNEFVADIYIKPAKSINFITLNFIATRTGISFEESIGLFRGTTNRGST